jgi:hypothetical protein
VHRSHPEETLALPFGHFVLEQKIYPVQAESSSLKISKHSSLWRLLALTADIFKLFRKKGSFQPTPTSNYYGRVVDCTHD